MPLDSCLLRLLLRSDCCSKAWEQRLADIEKMDAQLGAFAALSSTKPCFAALRSMWKMYNEVLSSVEPQVAQLQSILHQAKDKKLERIWLRNRSDGELDDMRLVEGVAGERLVFKKRGKTETKSKFDDDNRSQGIGRMPCRRFHWIVSDIVESSLY